MKKSTAIGLTYLAIIAAAASATASAQTAKLPEFEGASTPLPGWSPGSYRGDFFKYKDEKPLFSITAANVAQYANTLTPGQVAMFKQVPGYRMDIYPTHRDCAAPEWLKANSKRNETEAHLDAAGENLVSAVLPGVPFPNPKTGGEAMWNFLTHYRGYGNVEYKSYTSISPRAGSDEWIDAVSDTYYFFPWGTKGALSLDQVNGLNFGIYINYVSPTALAGQALVGRQYFNKTMETYYYFAGQRRVRRLPVYDHDAPLIGYENVYLQDESGLFNGPIDRFDFQIVGRETHYVPYNDFKMWDFRQPYHDVVRKDAVNPDNRRYEAHEVLHLSGTLKPGLRHVVARKDIYLDVDSWLYLVGEDYDSQGKLWKVREGYPAPIWELEGVCDAMPLAQYDFAVGRYVVDQSILGSGKDIRYFSAPEGDIHMTAGFYTPESLRMVSER